MKLLIISHTPHYIQAGQVVGWEPTIQEINHLASMFDEIRHLAMLHKDSPPSSVLPYSTERISFVPAEPSGGKRFWNKLSILAMAPAYLSRIWKNLKWADMVHVRCPSNISLMAILLLIVCRNPKFRWIKYATNWSPTDREPWSFSLQRWLLMKNFHHGIVTVNGAWPNQPNHVYSFFNPCVQDDRLLDAAREAGEKRFEAPFHFLHVGRLVEQKGLEKALVILAELRQRGIDFRFDIVGDGERSKFQRKTKTLELEDVVHFHGWLNRSALNALYRSAHFLLFPSSSSEGWPKVLSEGMAYGVVPIAGAISSIPQILSELRAGVALPLDDLKSFAESIMDYIHHPQKWYLESQQALSGVHQFTYTSYLEKLDMTFQKSWDIAPKYSRTAEYQSECN